MPDPQATAAEIKLTDREMAIAREAAKIAVEEIATHFYAQVGKGVVTKFFVWAGLLALGFGYAKGWINITPPK